MELAVRIIHQGALEERDYNNERTGQTEKFACMPFVLRHGSDTIYAEMIQETARKQGTLDPNHLYIAYLSTWAKPWSNNNERYENRFTLNRIVAL